MHVVFLKVNVSDLLFVYFSLAHSSQMVLHHTLVITDGQLFFSSLVDGEALSMRCLRSASTSINEEDNLSINMNKLVSSCICNYILCSKSINSCNTNPVCVFPLQLFALRQRDKERVSLHLLWTIACLSYF